MREVKRFLEFCKTSGTKSPSDSIVLYTFRKMGQVSGERLVACCNQIIASLTLVGIKFEDNTQARIREVTRYANLGSVSKIAKVHLIPII